MLVGRLGVLCVGILFSCLLPSTVECIDESCFALIVDREFEIVASNVTKLFGCSFIEGFKFAEELVCLVGAEALDCRTVWGPLMVGVAGGPEVERKVALHVGV